MKRILFSVLLGLSVLCPVQSMFSDDGNDHITKLQARIAELQKELGVKWATVTKGGKKVKVAVVRRPTKYDRDFAEKNKKYRELKAAEKELKRMEEEIDI